MGARQSGYKASVGSQPQKQRAEPDEAKSQVAGGRVVPSRQPSDKSKVSIFRSKDSTLDKTEDAKTPKITFKITNNSPKFTPLANRQTPSNKRGPSPDSFASFSKHYSKLP